MMRTDPTAWHGIWMLVMGVIVVVPFWRICSRVGYTGFWALLILVPVANLVFLYFLAFADWPAQRLRQPERHD